MNTRQPSAQDDLKTILILLTLGIVSAFLLTLMARYAYPLIEKNREQALREALAAVLPAAVTFERVESGLEFYRGLDSQGRVVGYAFVGEGGGYQGIIRIMIGIEPHWQRLTGIRVLENIETPGLGAKIASEEFQRQFRQLEVHPQISYVQNRNPETPNQIRAITGATISSRSVVKILNQTISEMETKFREASSDRAGNTDQSQ